MDDMERNTDRSSAAKAVGVGAASEHGGVLWLPFLPVTTSGIALMIKNHIPPTVNPETSPGSIQGSLPTPGRASVNSCGTQSLISAWPAGNSSSGWGFPQPCFL